jgi:PAS domain S-box-containing protein
MDAPANAPSSDDLNVVAYFEALCDAYAILDANLRIVFVNRKFLDLTGRPRDELVGAPVSHFDLIGASEQQASRAHWISAACGELHPGETKVSPPLAGAFAPSGGSVPVFQAWEIKASRLSLNVSSAYFTLQVSDVTARVEREDADKREKARLRSQAQLRQLVAAEREAA